MRNFKSLTAAVVAAAVSLVSCSQGAGISGTLSDAPESEVIVKLLNVNTYEVLDTVKVSKDGDFAYKVKIAKGQPEFIYLFHNDTKIASLLLCRGDKVKVIADTLGTYSVTGSEESEKLQKVEKDFTNFLLSFAATTDRMQGTEAGSDEAKEVQRELSKQYIDYYRNCVRYILTNSGSMTCIPVLYQSINENFPVFSQQTDAIHFKNEADTLSKLYPDSRYVKALRAEALRRQNILSVGTKLSGAKSMNFPDIEMPDMNGKKVKLSEVNSKLVILLFWTATGAGNKLFNQDVLKPLYETYHDKGLEIYQVGIDTDKGNWASVVKSQKLPWINVCDGLGTASTSASIYNITKLPVAYFIQDGKLIDKSASTKEGLNRLVESLL